MHRSALPNAVRASLNAAGFSMKGLKGKEGLIKQYGNKIFEHERSKTFLKAMSVLEKAKGFDIKEMKATAGIGKMPKKSKVADALAVQEDGGTLKRKREYFPMNKARNSGNKGKTIAARNRLMAIGKPNIDDNKEIVRVYGVGDGKALRKAVYKDGAKYVIYTKNQTTLFAVRTATSKKLEMTPLYRYNKGYMPRVKRHSFISPAGIAAAAGIARAFIKAAEWEFTKLKYK
jgi:hypothetical protein